MQSANPCDSYFERFSQDLWSGSEANLMVLLKWIVIKIHNATRFVLYSQGEIYCYQNYVTRNESKLLTLYRTRVAYFNVLSQHVLALLFNIIIFRSIIKAHVYYTHHLL
jgi:hypothetical protein